MERGHAQGYLKAAERDELTRELEAVSDGHLGSRLAAPARPEAEDQGAGLDEGAQHLDRPGRGRLGVEARGGRLGWLIASSVAIAAVQRAIDAEGRHLSSYSRAAPCFSTD